MMKPVGKPDAGNRHVRFDERGWETGRRLGVSTRAHPRLYRAEGTTGGGPPGRPAKLRARKTQRIVLALYELRGEGDEPQPRL
jgi:hypothetical protein